MSLLHGTKHKNVSDVGSWRAESVMLRMYLNQGLAAWPSEYRPEFGRSDPHTAVVNVTDRSEGGSARYSKHSNLVSDGETAW